MKSRTSLRSRPRTARSCSISGPTTSQRGWTDGEGWMESMVAVRAELMRGDLRALYLGWLASLRYLEPDDDAEAEAGLEPPFPRSVEALEAARDTGGFPPTRCGIDPLRRGRQPWRGPSEPARIETDPWIKSLPVADKDDYSQRFLARRGQHAPRGALEAVSRSGGDEGQGQGKGVPHATSSKQRTIGQLLQARDALVEETTRLEAKKAAAEDERKNREQAEARAPPRRDRQPRDGRLERGRRVDRHQPGQSTTEPSPCWSTSANWPGEPGTSPKLRRRLSSFANSTEEAKPHEAFQEKQSRCVTMRRFTLNERSFRSCSAEVKPDISGKLNPQILPCLRPPGAG